jgi:fermentation-respiration switch protein FrsA (DUF1100 family)
VPDRSDFQGSNGQLGSNGGWPVEGGSTFVWLRALDLGGVRQIQVLIALVVAAAGLAGCTGGGDRVQASMSVSPQTALLDEPVAVSVRGLPTGARTTVTATATDAGGITWSASAQFQATSAYDVDLQATVGDRVAAGATVRRQGPAAVGVVEKELRPASGGIYGNLYLPKTTATRRPGVLVFGGSDGGLSTSFAAALLAAHGYPSLALAYFKAPGLPRGLNNLPLEYFPKALGVLRSQPGVDPRHVLVMGVSRGGEAALLLGAYFPRLVNGVIAGVPSSVVNPGWPDTSQPAWTLGGRPLPAVSPSEFGQPNPPGKPQVVIPVDRIRGPILVTCGELDVVWPSCAYTAAITARLRARRFAYPVSALRYRDAGHLVGGLTAYFASMTDDALTSYGGTVAGTQAAQADAHTKLLALLASQ